MKKYFLILAIILSPFVLLSQETLRVVYEQRNFNPVPENLSTDANFKLAASMYNDRTYDFELFIHGNQSLWKRIPHVQEEGIITIDGQWYSFDSPDNSTYLRNLSKNTIQYEVKKNQVVEDSVSNKDWNIAREKKSYFGYEVRKATRNLEYGEIEALFTTDLNYSTGPWKVGGLPGLILYYKFTLNDGFSMEYKIKNIEILEKCIDFDIFKDHEILEIETYKKMEIERRQKAKEMFEAGVDTTE